MLEEHFLNHERIRTENDALRCTGGRCVGLCRRTPHAFVPSVGNPRCVRFCVPLTPQEKRVSHFRVAGKDGVPIRLRAVHARLPLEGACSRLRDGACAPLRLRLQSLRFGGRYGGDVHVSVQLRATHGKRCKMCAPTRMTDSATLVAARTPNGEDICHAHPLPCGCTRRIRVLGCHGGVRVPKMRLTR